MKAIKKYTKSFKTISKTPTIPTNVQTYIKIKEETKQIRKIEAKLNQQYPKHIHQKYIMTIKRRRIIQTYT